MIKLKIYIRKTIIRIVNRDSEAIAMFKIFINTLKIISKIIVITR